MKASSAEIKALIETIERMRRVLDETYAALETANGLLAPVDDDG